jgi:hypothetical protein
VIPAYNAAHWEDRFSQIARMSLNVGQKPRCHTMLFSYFDDSGDPRHQKYFSVGGLIAGERQWTNFHVPWAVATINLTEPFRSTECECQQGQFSTWTKTACDQLMDRLVTIILDLEIHGFASVVPIAPYRAVFPDAKEYDPYYLAVRHTLINMAHIGHAYKTKWGIEGMTCWFEDGDATTGSTRRIYKELRSTETWETAGSLSPCPIFEDKNLRPLQAADLVAREAFKHFLNLGERPTCIPLKRMTDLLTFAVWDQSTLEYLRDHGGPEDLGLLTSWEKWEALGRPQPPPFTTFWRNF